jgi:hypothetical protein
MGGNTLEDEMRFATAARVSEINLAAYRTFVQPWIKAMAPKGGALENLHPVRMQYEVFSKSGPLMSAVEKAAEQVRERRAPAAPDNPFLAMQERMSKQITGALDAWATARDRATEAMFLTVYGSPMLQALTGVSADTVRRRKPGKSALHGEMLRMRIADIKARTEKGGLQECVIRGLIYSGAKRGAVDERSLQALRRINLSEGGPRLTLAQFKAMVREQFFLLLLDQEAALAAIPKLLPEDRELRRKGLAAIADVLNASGEIEGEVADRYMQVMRLFDAGKADEQGMAKAS